MFCLSPTHSYIYTFLHYCLLLRVVMPSILSVCVYVCVCVCVYVLSVSLIMYQHSDGLTPILLSSFSLFSSFFPLISSGHGASAVLSFYLLLQHDVYLSLLHPISVSRHSSLPDRLSFSRVGWYVSLCASSYPFGHLSGIIHAVRVERHVWLSHPWVPAHFYQQTVLSSTLRAHSSAHTTC